MGAGAAQRQNGPWVYNISFPRVLSGYSTPERPEDVSESIKILDSPVPAYGAVIGEDPIGVIVKDESSFQSVKLPVFEWQGYESSFSALPPLRDQHYFVLTQKYRGEAYQTKRMTIGKVAVNEDVIACTMPVKSSPIARREDRETAVIREASLGYSIGKAVMKILNDTQELPLSYNDVRNANFVFALAKHVESRKATRERLSKFTRSDQKF